MKKKFFEYDGTSARRKNRFLPRLILCLFLAVIAAVCSSGISKLITEMREKNSHSPDQLYSLWTVGDFKAVYDLSSEIIAEQPFQNTACSFLGYSAYYLSLSQIDPSLALSYLDESVAALRIAELDAKERVLPQIQYMLGKAYFLKNTLNSYNYYSDLAVKYLSAAKSAKYDADDISEYLGLSYASLDMTEKSIEAFTNALAVRESDMLLLSIGEQYLKNGNLSVAKQYFFRVVSTSADDSLVLKSRNLLGKLHIEEKDYEEAEKEFRAILEKDINFADAYYGLGVLYEEQGDMVKARSQWRNALKAQVNHPAAKQKLGA